MPVAVIVEVPDCPGAAIVTAVDANVKVGPPVIETCTAADAGDKV